MIIIQLYQTDATSVHLHTLGQTSLVYERFTHIFAIQYSIVGFSTAFEAILLPFCWVTNLALKYTVNYLCFCNTSHMEVSSMVAGTLTYPEQLWSFAFLGTLDAFHCKTNAVKNFCSYSWSMGFWVYVRHISMFQVVFVNLKREEEKLIA